MADTVPSLGYVVRGGNGMHPGSAHVRVVRNVLRGQAAGRFTARQVHEDSDLSGLDVVLVQRDALGSYPASAFAQAVRAAGARLVVDVDDDFFTDEAVARLTAQEYLAESLTSLHELVALADMVLVSTAPLADVVCSRNATVLLVPNTIDEALWTTSRTRVPSRFALGEPRLLYMGTSTHGADLQLLKGAIEEGGIGLDVVGVTSDDEGWYRRIPIPEDRTHYPEFVRWLAAHRVNWIAGVAPLVDDRFNSSKSDLKFLEYSMLGLPTVASDTVSYRGADRHGARLVAPSAWSRAIMELSLDRRLRRSMIAKSLAYVQAERTIGTSSVWERAVFGRAGDSRGRLA